MIYAPSASQLRIRLGLAFLLACVLVTCAAAEPVRQRAAEDLHNLMGKGLRLQEIDSFRGISTHRYSVAQWNALIALPDAKGLGPAYRLSDEADEVAIQAMINAADARKEQSTAVIDLPTGVFRLTRPIKSGCKQLLVRGAGVFATSIVQTVGGEDGWHHGTIDTPCEAKYSSRIVFQNIQVLATGVGGTALVFDMDPTSGGVTLENLDLNGTGNMTSNFWHDGIKCNNCSLSVFDNVNVAGIIGGNVSKTGIGLLFTGNAASSYNWYGGNINGFDTGVSATSGDGQDLEGFLFDGLDMNNVNFGFKIKWSSGMQSPQWYIINGQFGNIAKTWIDASGVSEIEITNNLTYSTAPGLRLTCQTTIGSRTLTNCLKPKGEASGLYAGHELVSSNLPSGAKILSIAGNSIGIDVAALASKSNASIVYQPEPATPFVTLNHVRNLTFRDNKEEFGSSSTHSNNIENILTIGDSNGIHVYSNFFGEYGSVMTAAFVDRGGNKDLLERDDSFIPWRTSVPKCVGCLSSGASARWATFYDANGCELGFSGFVTCHGSSVAALDALRQASIRFPSPVFLTTPTVIATNGDYAALATPCGPVASSITAMGFSAKCLAGVENWPVRINWTAIGR